MEGAKLIVNEVPGLVKCKQCGEAYLLLENNKDGRACCPKCQHDGFDLMEGSRDVIITELGVPE